MCASLLNRWTTWGRIKALEARHASALDILDTLVQKVATMPTTLMLDQKVKVAVHAALEKTSSQAPSEKPEKSARLPMS